RPGPGPANGPEAKGGDSGLPLEAARRGEPFMSRRLWIAGGAAALLGATVTVAALSRSSGSDEPKTRLPPATAKVTKATLVETKTVAGTLGYGGTIPVGATRAGTLTCIAPAGSTLV